MNVDLMKIAEEYDFAPAARIESDFFVAQDERDIPFGEDSVQEKDKKGDFADWKLAVDRLFMEGKTKDGVLKALGEKILNSMQKDDILAYLDKYEGLIGTVFVDSSVVASGMPLSLIPKKFKPYHRFAVNCKSTRWQSVSKVEGGAGGDIDQFLNAMDSQIKVDKVEVCVYTGLPVLKKGMFTPEVISDIMESLGERGDTLEGLQSALKRHLFESNVALTTDTQNEQKPDYNSYGIKSSELLIEIPDYLPEDSKPITVKTYAPKEEQDLTLTEVVEPFKDIKIDGALRF